MIFIHCVVMEFMVHVRLMFLVFHWLLYVVHVCKHQMFISFSQATSVFLYSMAARVAKQQPCFTTIGAEDRVIKNYISWQQQLQLPGVVDTSWLHRVDNGNFKCLCCHCVSQKSGESKCGKKRLHTDIGLELRDWTRLQTFKTHHLNSKPHQERFHLHPRCKARRGQARCCFASH